MSEYLNVCYLKQQCLFLNHKSYNCTYAAGQKLKAAKPPDQKSHQLRKRISN